MPILPVRRKGGGWRAFEEYDFGPVLARGQTLRHEFTFTNSTKRPIRLTGATATTPCCSEIGTLPKEAIPSGGRCPIPVVLKVAPLLQTEKKRVEFLVQTDSNECPSLAFALSAMIHPEWEVRASPDSTRTLPIGQAGQQVIRITCRRVAGEGTILPSGVEVESPLVARFLGEPGEQTEAQGIKSQTRDVEVTLPRSPRPGSHQGTIRFRWPEGRTREQLVFWIVVPPVRANPSRLVVRPSERDVTHTIVLTSFNGRPFRIGQVGPPHLVVSPEFDRAADRSHTLKLRIDPEQASRDQNPRVIIKTDVDDQPAVSLNIVVLPPGV